MKNSSELRHSLAAVKQTRQITNAMYLLSVSEMRRCLSHISYAAEYMQTLRETKRELLAMSRDFDHPFKRSFSKGGRRVFIIIAAEKGMCGSYNANIAALAKEKILATEDPYVVIKGGYVKNMLAPAGIYPDQEWNYPGNFPKIEYAEDVADKLIELYLTDEICEVDIIYTKYLSQIEQVAKCYRLLPLSNDFFSPSNDVMDHSMMDFYPSADKVFFDLTRQFIRGFVYSAMYQSFVSEHVARMNAMKSATNNADGMIRDISSKLNSLRQLAITNELIEITSAAENTAETGDSAGRIS